MTTYSSVSAKAFTIPVYVGGYQIGGDNGLTVNLTRKPSAWHRFWMRACLGWTWKDAAFDWTTGTAIPRG